MLRLKIRVERIDDPNKYLEVIGIANSGFIGYEPEILLPSRFAETLNLDEVAKPTVHMKVSGDGRHVELIKYMRAVKTYVVTDDRVVGPVVASVLVSQGSKHILLNDKLLGELGIVLIDFGKGIWCFRDEIGKKTRITY